MIGTRSVVKIQTRHGSEVPMVATAKLTLAEFLALPEDGKRYELIDGELFVAATPNRKHFWTHRRLLNHFIDLVEGSDWGYVFYAPVEVRLGGPTALEPDHFVLRKDRLSLFDEAAVIGAPDIVVEVLSPSTRNVDLALKRRRNEQAGVREYWIADPERDTRTATPGPRWPSFMGALSRANTTLVA